MSRKIERLVNLTIALLATRRFLTKSEIFRTVDGYEGTAETKERMFERDKDDLRALGIEISVGTFDPVFQDAVGYRINSETYQLELGVISPLDLSILSMAAGSWQGAALDEAARNAVLKLHSMDISAEGLEIPGVPSRLADSSKDLAVISNAIFTKSSIAFNYLSADLQSERRAVIPFSLATYKGFWYVACLDQGVQEVRIFRLDRITGDVQNGKIQAAFVAPENFDFYEALTISQSKAVAVLEVRKGKGQLIRNLAISTSDQGEWDRIEIPIVSVENIRSLILWHGVDVLVVSPPELRTMVIESLQKIVVNHG